MFNPYQAQGNAPNQQQTGFYSQQPGQLNQRPTTEFGNFQQNIPNSFGNQHPQQQQQQSAGNMQNLGSMYQGGNEYAAPPQGSLQSMQTGFSTNPAQGPYAGHQQQGGFFPNQNPTSLQPQQTGYYSQQGTPQIQQQPPQVPFYQQNQPQSVLQQQQTGVASNAFSPQPSAPQQYQQNSFPSQPMQNQPTTGLSQQTAHPVQPQQTGFFSQPLQQQQQANAYSQQNPQPVQPQQTGLFSQPSLQPLQQQPTGFYSQSNIQQQGSQYAQQTPQPLQPQQTGFYRQQAQETIQPLKPTATGFVNSFANNGINNDIKIPNMRLSFITANDQAKFETLFRSSVPLGSNTISGDACRTILMKSGVSPTQLAKIWTLCDTSRAGELLFPEFALAMHLVNAVIQGDSVPFELDTRTKNEVESFVSAINTSIANGSFSESSKPKTPFDDLTSGILNLQPQPTGSMPQTSFGMPLQAQNTQGLLNPQATGFMPQTSFGQSLVSQQTGGNLQSQYTGGFLQPQSTGFMPPTSFNQPLQTQATGGVVLQPQSTGWGNPVVSVPTGQPMGSVPNRTFDNPSLLQPQPTGYLPPSSFNPSAPLSAQKTGFGNNEIYSQSNFASKFFVDNSDVITNEEKSLFYKIFDTYDTQNKGLMDSSTAVEVFRKSGLSRSDLEHIWNLCDTNNNGQLNRQEFALGMHLVYRRLSGNDLPNRLPPSLIPSSTQILNSVKNQLKSSPDAIKKAPTKVDGFSFKHDDDEMLPSSRNRRRTISESKNTEKQGTSSISTAGNQKLQVDESPVQLSTTTKNDYNQRLSGEQAIEDLKRKLNSLPRAIDSSNNLLTGETKELKAQFDSLASRVPQILAEISDVNNQIATAKIELYRQRNPSSLVGTGANGEVTDEDRRKAKSKALLASRMAALTGRPVSGTNVDQQEQKFNEEVSKIKSENSTNQSIIEEIQSSIFEIAASVNSALVGKANTNGSQYQKWELGVGLDPQVSAYIASTRPISVRQTANVNPSNDRRSFENSNNGFTTPSQAKVSNTRDRSTFLKEQAQRKMNERLAKLGLGSGNSSSSEVPKSVERPAQLHTEPQPIERENDEDDEEVERLAERLEALKAKKKAAQEAAQPKKDVSALAEDRSEFSQTAGAADTGARSAATLPATLPAMSVNSNGQAIGVANNSNAGKPEAVEASEVSSHQTNNPFNRSLAHSALSPATQPASSTSTGGRNPFFKPSQSGASTFDAKAAEAQRRIQRGLDDNDDDWSDDEQTHLAPQAPAPQAPAPQAPAPQAPAPQAPVPQAPAPQAPAASQPVVPIAPPLPRVGQDEPTTTVTSQVPLNGYSLPQSPREEDEGDHSDDLSIPESVDSFDDLSRNDQLPPSGIPPPPPLP
ncbi:actin cytoskeleton-regulatory complex protein PAN1 [Lachancea thermotolerans CBS 6340]|uniref:Actin cytoskeleton-regulatory complex protein PAN1 n=1 Tax=Lachancea thermotolerans (strain ATCC 56472 / CBS 6340 / NRRL Y-8284) TaxID=559295 RepID=C5DJ48_LACTC|nr:KLTH0F13464p [Lachancea thermotolerans CBS 6340]CAR24337.1 KLTH0F13464p [Lachancea thermotolerans CBS 6340]